MPKEFADDAIHMEKKYHNDPSTLVLSAPPHARFPPRVNACGSGGY